MSKVVQGNGIKYRLLNWKDVQEECEYLYRKMSDKKFKPDCIIGLLRGGIVPARIFSDYFDILLDFYALDVKLYDGINKRREEATVKAFYGDVKGKKILVIDDIWDSGKTMKAVLKTLEDEDVTTATLFWKEGADRKPDYYARVAKKKEWISFPWERDEFRRELLKEKDGKPD